MLLVLRRFVVDRRSVASSFWLGETRLASLRRAFATPAKAKEAGVKKGKGNDGKPEIAPLDPTAPLDVSFLVVMKNDTPPLIKADNQYPEWLFDRDIYEPPSLAELRVRVDNGEKLSPEMIRRKDKLERKRAIKETNEKIKKS